MADGGNFSTDVDGGTFVLSNNIYGNLDLDLSSTYLYDAGNETWEAVPGSTHGVIVKTGMLSRFYQISAINIVNQPNLTADNQLFSILAGTGYDIYDTTNQIIYGKTSHYNFDISGVTANGNIVSKRISSPTNGPNYYPYRGYVSDTNIVPSEDLLYVYNLDNQESIDIKNYYFSMRTGVTGANILGINCGVGYSGVRTDTGNYITNIRTPIHRFIMTGKKPIRYGCLFHGIPVQITGLTNPPVSTTSVSVCYDLSTSLNNNSGYSRSQDFQYSDYVSKGYLRYSSNPSIDRPFLLEEYSGNSALFCHLATRLGETADLSGYIKRICRDGVVDGPYLKGSGQNTTFLCYSNGGPAFTGVGQEFQYRNQFQRTSEFYNGLGVNIFISKGFANAPVAVITGINVGGFVSDGNHTRLYVDGTGNISIGGEMAGNWIINQGRTDAFQNGDKLSKLTGYNWFLSSHYESYPGDLLYGGDWGFAPFNQHISPTAMGGSDYNNVAVGFVGSMIEPYYDGIEKITMFDAWFQGRPFIEAAYMGINTVHYAIMGDPLVKWR